MPEDLRDALYVLGQYLSDHVAPLMALDALTLLMGQPLALVAQEIGAWSMRQAEVRRDVGLPDLLFHAARKVHMMGDFSLIEPGHLDEYLRGLGPLLLQLCPEEGRATLAEGLSRLDESRQALTSRVEIVHRQAGAPDPKQAAEDGAAAAPQILSAVVEGLGRLPLLLRRLEGFASLRPTDATATAPAAPLPAGSVRSAVLADAVLEASLQARDASELEAHLGRIRSLAAASGTEEMLRALGGRVSGWVLPADSGTPPDGPPVDALRRLIVLSDEPAEAGRRFREMVHAAIEQFNAGAHGRALKMFDLARRMVAAGEVRPQFVEPMVASGHEYVSGERLRKLVERPDSRTFAQPVLAFFRSFAPDRLLDELQTESRRDRRRLLLNLLETHGASARAAAWQRLLDDPEGRVAGVYFARNLVCLLKSIPAPGDAPAEQEIDVVARLAEPGFPLLLAKEALGFLVARRHPRAEARLLQVFAEIEEALAERTASAEDRALLAIQLDRAAAALARLGTPAAWARLVEHALARDGRHGDTLARLAELGTQDLSAAPQVLARLTQALEAELPRGVLGRILSGREASIGRLVAALAGTRAPRVQALLTEVAERHPGQAIGREARKLATALDQPRGDGAVAQASISGDLDLFGLPTLLQNLSELGKTGLLSLLDARGRLVASLRLESGALCGARCGARKGREAVYQLIERPFPATFAFVPGKPGAADVGQPIPVAQVLLEAVGRHEELERALALVPEDAPLEATGRSPSAVPDEADYDLVVALWQRACAGAPPAAVEENLPVDSYRVFRALAHWVEEGSLRTKGARPAA
jgi:hypothetical protein